MRMLIVRHRNTPATSRQLSVSCKRLGRACCVIYNGAVRWNLVAAIARSDLVAFTHTHQKATIGKIRKLLAVKRGLAIVDLPAIAEVPVL